MLPTDKAAYVAQLQREGRKVCFVGDGINDAIALTQANVSISLVKGLKDTQLRLLAIAGSADFANTDLLANAGLGWDVGKNSLLLNAGLQVPYARAFLDYTISDASFRAFL